jgi:predicted rRNA methylase YqxC with S4 and FtsJ domains/very-short-patch-repair endonuclease
VRGIESFVSEHRRERPILLTVAAPHEAHRLPFVSRAGGKLEHALTEFAFDVTGLACADFGCNIGGFTDCLLQRGAALVHAIDTGYGTLAYKLRIDPRVVVMERTNALHALPPSPSGRGAGGEGEPAAKPSVPAALLESARRLRKEHSDAEGLMWGLLRNRRLLDLKFRRQHPVDSFILDFYCDELKLAIELDGGQHNQQETRVRDESRTRALEARNVHVLRFWNHEVLTGTDTVLEVICRFAQEVRAQGQSPSPQPSPGGRGSRTVDLVVIDLAWTPQRLAIPAAARWLAPDGHIIALVKPHYEAQGEEQSWLVNGCLTPDQSRQVFERVLSDFPSLGVMPLKHCLSPMTGGKSGKKAGSGNAEFLVLARPI